MSHSHPAMSARSGTSWGEIEPSLLEDVRAPVPAFPLDRLPPFWRDWVGTTARSAGAPADYVAQSVLAAVAGIAGAGVQVRITPRWVEPLVLWQAVVGPPSSGKSSAMAPVRDMLLALEPKPAAGGNAKPRRLVEDAAIDRVADALDAHPRGVILWRDEPVDLAVRLGGPAPGRHADDDLRASWRQAWSAGPVTPGKGVRLFNRFAVSQFIALKPEPLAELLLASEELSARFHCVAAYAGLRTARHARGRPRRRGLDRFAAAGREAGDVRRRTSGPCLDEAGLAAFDAFANRLHDQRRDLEGLELAWLGKGASVVARLAAALQLLSWSRDTSGGAAGAIGRDQVERAIALWSDYFRPHALALFHRMAPTEQEHRARAVVRWLQRRRVYQVSREDIRRKALGRAVNAFQAEQVMFRLAQDGVVERASDGTPARGRPSSKWWVNPALFESPLAEKTEITAGA